MNQNIILLICNFPLTLLIDQKDMLKWQSSSVTVSWQQGKSECWQEFYKEMVYNYYNYLWKLKGLGARYIPSRTSRILSICRNLLIWRFKLHNLSSIDFSVYFKTLSNSLLLVNLIDFLSLGNILRHCGDCTTRFVVLLILLWLLMHALISVGYFVFTYFLFYLRICMK